MKGLGVLALLTVAAIALAPQGSAGIVSPVTWTSSHPASEVALGGNLYLTVSGPPNGTFSVAVYPQPFNYSQAIESFSFNLTNQTNATGYAEGIATIPSAGMYLNGLYELRVWNDTVGVFSESVVMVALGGNLSQINNRLNSSDLNGSVGSARQSSLLAHQGMEDFWNIFAVAGSWSVSGIVILVLVVTRTRVGATPLGRRARAFGTSLISRTEGVHFGDEVPIETDDNPEAVWKCPVFRECIACRTRQTYQSLEWHLQHPTTESGHDPIPNPGPEFFVRDPTELKSVAAGREQGRVDRAIIEKSIASVPAKIDWASADEEEP